MQTGDSTRRLARLLIWILCAVGLILIVSIVSGSRFDRDSARAVGMAVAVAVFSLTGTASLRLARQRPELTIVGAVSAVLSVGAFLAVTGLLWGDMGGGTDARVAGATIVLALAGGHLSVLLGSTRSTDPEAVRLLRGWVLVCLGALVVMAIFELSEHGEQLDWRLLGVFAVLYVIGSVLLPLLRRVSKPSGEAEPGAAAGTAAAAPALRLEGVAIGIRDVDRAIAFYRELLDAQPLRLAHGRVAFRIGGQHLEAHAYEPGASAGIPPGSGRLSLRWEGPIQSALDHLQRRGVRILAGPRSEIGAEGPRQALYFRDPDENLIALVSYEAPRGL